MKYITRDEVKELAARPPQQSATIYMPSHRISTPPHISEDMTRYKNLVAKVEGLLKEKGVAHDEASAIVGQLQHLETHQDFWKYQTDGLAVLADKDTVYAYNISTDIDEYAAVDERFHLTPLMLQMEENQQYYVLALAVHNPKLFVGDLSSLREADIELPTDPESALNIDEMHINQLQSRNPAVRQPNSGNAPALFHGHGGSPRDIASEERHRFFKMIDEIICKNVDTSLPLVLVSTDDQIVEYKGAAKHENIVDQHIDGNRTHEKIEELHKLSWQVINENVILAQRGNVVEQYQELIGQHRAVADFAQVQSLATEGRIDTLLLGMIITTTDTVKDQAESVPRIVFPEKYDAVEACALDVYSQSGRVLGVSREHMPEQAVIAALLRY